MADKPRKKGINSKQKGSEYERKIAKLLGTWFKEEFHRVPQSGGLHWGDDTRVAGDITTHIDSKFPFTVECKKREGWDLEQLLKGTGDLESWWAQAVNDSNRVGLLPMLVFSKNFSPNYLMIQKSAFDKLVAKKVDPIPFNFFAVGKYGEESRVVCVLDQFTQFITKEEVLESLPRD